MLSLAYSLLFYNKTANILYSLSPTNIQYSLNFKAMFFIQYSASSQEQRGKYWTEKCFV
jgi:hypothetical protein